MKKSSQRLDLATPLRDVAARDPAPLHDTCSIKDAAAKMRALDTGTLPVESGGKLVGQANWDLDRSSIKFGHDPADIPVKSKMSDDVVYCFEDESIGDAIVKMRDSTLNNLPVVDTELRITGVVNLQELERLLAESKFADDIGVEDTS